MSAEIARSRPTSAHDDSTVAPTPNVNSNEKKSAPDAGIDATVAPGSTEEEEDVEKGGPPKSAVNESDLLTGRTLVVVWIAFLLSVSSCELWQTSSI
jgi:hypothetical protein